MSSAESDRRRFPRSHSSVPARAADVAPEVFNHVDNISANGVLCHTNRPVALMTRMQIALELPKPFDRFINADGVVVRCDPHEEEAGHYQVAILFTRISDEDHKAVHKFVEHDLAGDSKGK
ncbi:MAG: PilZ domain-containing protein [Candidatus Hydrogenedentes bacterium]|nr:PilZ domain-containing protein [Candidatus Hydrogenedentota bacterium]